MQRLSKRVTGRCISLARCLAFLGVFSFSPLFGAPVDLRFRNAKNLLSQSEKPFSGFFAFPQFDFFRHDIYRLRSPRYDLDGYRNIRGIATAGACSIVPGRMSKSASVAITNWRSFLRNTPLTVAKEFPTYTNWKTGFCFSFTISNACSSKLESQPLGKFRTWLFFSSAPLYSLASINSCPFTNCAFTKSGLSVDAQKSITELGSLSDLRIVEFPPKDTVTALAGGLNLGPCAGGTARFKSMFALGVGAIESL